MQRGGPQTPPPTGNLAPRCGEIGTAIGTAATRCAPALAIWRRLVFCSVSTLLLWCFRLANLTSYAREDGVESASTVCDLTTTIIQYKSVVDPKKTTVLSHSC